MGQQVCGQHRRAPPDFGLGSLPKADLEGFESLLLQSSYSSTHRFEAYETHPAEQYALGYESAAMVPVLFDVQPQSMQDGPSTRSVIHRASKVVRRLISVRKPCGAERQARLRASVLRLHGLRAPGVAHVLEAFEDARSMSLITESCTGGSMYERILNHQYFSEQESAVVVRHLLQAVASLHESGLGHGFLSPDCFKFESQQTHAPLKLVDYGLELKVHLWESLSGGPLCGVEAGRRTTYLQLWETCNLVFCPPEVVCATQAVARVGGVAAKRMQNSQKGSPRAGRRGEPSSAELLGEAIDAHMEQCEEIDGVLNNLEAADSWGVGAIAFLLLCGYPPFFAPCRYAIVSRISKTDFAFDPPFWSKISEEAKDFVQQCLRGTPERRLSVAEALHHPWIQSLADTSPSGSMLNSFAVNLRRFYRTSLIEGFAASSLAAELTVAETNELLARCRDADANKTGFVTSTDLRQVLVALNHGDVAEAIVACISTSKMLRYPGESYIDYVALLESTRLRRERIFEEELWRRFLDFADASPPGAAATVGIAESGRLQAACMQDFLQAPSVPRLLVRAGVDDAAAALRASAEVLLGPGAGIGGSGSAGGAEEADFLDVASELLRRLPLVSQEHRGGGSGRRPQPSPVSMPAGDMAGPGPG
mmetsp:Transcript_68467/g.222800  ORF Transcript_68467/g.222800 Transcript_68467/m.222800 type:complete len:651 (-) Transcript_68467:47-1999(-)|eukprot:CAMPEP_0203933332 /NCGR_PEP_ID=MMETSP0359-20131031/71540_1 /ASSEMBLY_ACC=CAM_ASM_000338 /TAXON_ID=268821 /ORGANISM="Scrippsiella Hangoei, Strain SHTV-5" /LENGTH=650 /DNA_ID=CAMNT_0050862903 /DNA_START=63 /DNA_END=2015 /DNA_ORIENTATION=+